MRLFRTAGSIYIQSFIGCRAIGIIVHFECCYYRRHVRTLTMSGLFQFWRRDSIQHYRNLTRNEAQRTHTHTHVILDIFIDIRRYHYKGKKKHTKITFDSYIIWHDGDGMKWDSNESIFFFIKHLMDMKKYRQCECNRNQEKKQC